MNPPTYRKQVQQFIGVVNYYRNMWPRRSHTLSPLTKITSKKGNLNGLKLNKMPLAKLSR